MDIPRSIEARKVPSKSETKFVIHIKKIYHEFRDHDSAESYIYVITIVSKNYTKLQI